MVDNAYKSDYTMAGVEWILKEEVGTKVLLS